MPTLLKEFIKNPRATGTLNPSSAFLAEMITTSVGIEQAKAVVELGPGTGAFTRHIADGLPADANFFTIELSEDLTKVFRKKFPDVKIYTDSAANLPQLMKLENMKELDVIISGLPWATFPAKLQRELLQIISSSLKPGGYFATFAYLQGMILPSARKFARRLNRRFDTVEKSPVVWRNVPPAFVYRCRKGM